MKILYAILFVTILSPSLSWSQTSPLDPVCTFNYQGVLRNDDYRGVFEQAIRVQFSVLDGPGGNALYIEQHETTTNSLGLFVLEIGGGDRVGGSMIFEVIPWVTRKHYLKVEIDDAGGTDFEEYGISPFLAVPIAVEAKVAAFAIHTLDTITCYDTLKVAELCADSIKAISITTKTICADSTKSEVICGVEIKAEKLSVDSICADEIKINGCVQVDTLKAKHIVLDGQAGGDGNPEDELQMLSKAGNIISLSRGGGAVTLNDDNASNELQEISKIGNQVALSNGGSITLLDDDPQNELQNLSVVNDELLLSGTNTRIPTDEFSPWTRDGSRLRTERTITGNGLEIGNESVVIEDRKITLHYPNGSGALVLDVDGDFGPSITFMTPGSEIIGSIKSDGEGGLALFSSSNEPLQRAKLPSDEEQHGTSTLLDGVAVVALDLPSHITADQVHIMLTPRSGDSKGLCVDRKNAREFEVKELFKGSGNYEFDYSVRILPSKMEVRSLDPIDKTGE